MKSKKSYLVIYHTEQNSAYNQYIHRFQAIDNYKIIIISVKVIILQDILEIKLTTGIFASVSKCTSEHI